MNRHPLAGIPISPNPNLMAIAKALAELTKPLDLRKDARK